MALNRQIRESAAQQRREIAQDRWNGITMAWITQWLESVDEHPEPVEVPGNKATVSDSLRRRSHCRNTCLPEYRADATKRYDDCRRQHDPLDPWSHAPKRTYDAYDKTYERGEQSNGLCKVLTFGLCLFHSGVSPS